MEDKHKAAYYFFQQFEQFIDKHGLICNECREFGKWEVKLSSSNGFIVIKTHEELDKARSMVLVQAQKKMGI